MSRRILAVFLAIVLAVLGTAAVLYYVNRADDRAVDGVSAIEVLVAQQRIATGTTGTVIRDRQLAVATRMPASSLPEGAVTSITPELEKQLVTSTLLPGQLLLRSMFANATETSSGLAIPSDKVAVSFEASMAQQVAGYVRPGAHVALFASYTATANGSKAIGGEGVRGTAVLLPRIEVIAIGEYGTGETTITPQEGEPDAEPTTLVTVAASTVDAAKIITAANAGAIYLALLTDESDVKAGVGVDDNNVFG
ncbi:pilus assembly protein CpaB [Catenuloplanes nepalensis]|uniref:Pilus assembly protein CpaB n=1 Tax=Catenuloplanes nepalensis TaxID=587533 RepID=A0ABT9N4B7_9ACTN|nr:RcpC/CpaB family pilus assembly protein [Catenuloplanes nepalensis]MDP9798549.1 pilus assembly protein CpaB [Catenuloplanes nepalensis]